MPNNEKITFSHALENRLISISAKLAAIQVVLDGYFDAKENPEALYGTRDFLEDTTRELKSLLEGGVVNGD